MPEPVRGIVLLLSLLLWSPVLPRLLAGTVSTEEAVLTYAGALLLSWGGCSALVALVRAYMPDPQPVVEVETGDPVPAEERGWASTAEASTAEPGADSTAESTEELRRRREDATP